MFCNILSEEYIVALGPNIVDRIRIALKSETRVIDLFGTFTKPDISSQTFDDTLNFVLLIYSRMRGKDFSMKLLKKNVALKLPVRQIQAVLSNPKHRIKTVSKVEDDLSEEDRKQNEEFAKIVLDMENDEAE